MYCLLAERNKSTNGLFVIKHGLPSNDTHTIRCSCFHIYACSSQTIIIVPSVGHNLRPYCRFHACPFPKKHPRLLAASFRHLLAVHLFHASFTLISLLLLFILSLSSIITTATHHHYPPRPCLNHPDYSATFKVKHLPLSAATPASHRHFYLLHPMELIHRGELRVSPPPAHEGNRNSRCPEAPPYKAYPDSCQCRPHCDDGCAMFLRIWCC